MAGLAAMSLVAVGQMTDHVSRASTPAQAAATSGFVAATGLKPGQQLAVASDVSYSLWAPQAFEVSWTALNFFNVPGVPPTGTAVVETAWAAGQSAAASWPQVPAGWHIVAATGRRLGRLAALVMRVTLMRAMAGPRTVCYTLFGGRYQSRLTLCEPPGYRQLSRAVRWP